MAQDEWIGVQIKVQFKLPALTHKYILEKMEELAVHPEKFLDLKTSECVLVLNNLARVPLKDLLTKYSALIDFIAQHDYLLFVMLMRMMNKRKRLKLTQRKYTIIQDAAEKLNVY